MTENTNGGDGENANMQPSVGSEWNITTSKSLIIVTIVYWVLLIGAGTAIGVGVHFATLGEDAATFSTEETVQSTTTVTIRTNGTYINQTRTVFMNGTYVNQTISVFVNGTCLNDTSIVDNNGTILNETITLCTNGTFVNQTMTVFQNGSFVNITDTVYQEGVAMNVTMIETQVISGTFSWWTSNGDWEYALGGADVVEYFSLDPSANAVQGDDAYTSTIYGITWRFKNQANKDLFDADPASYVPVYGAHCAYAMSRNYIAKGDPNAWTVYNGKLYINFSKSIRSSWSNNKRIADGDRNWENMGYDNPH